MRRVVRNMLKWLRESWRGMGGRWKPTCSFLVDEVRFSDWHEEVLFRPFIPKGAKLGNQRVIDSFDQLLTAPCPTCKVNQAVVALHYSLDHDSCERKEYILCLTCETCSELAPTMAGAPA
ncbi:MAG: hypothetical protein Q7S89_01260 [bacterium]|nr:hypothetical protein [bacterium]